jgi:hypothetical protein
MLEPEAFAVTSTLGDHLTFVRPSTTQDVMCSCNQLTVFRSSSRAADRHEGIHLLLFVCGSFGVRLPRSHRSIYTLVYVCLRIKGDFS